MKTRTDNNQKPIIRNEYTSLEIDNQKLLNEINNNRHYEKTLCILGLAIELELAEICPRNSPRRLKVVE